MNRDLMMICLLGTCFVLIVRLLETCDFLVEELAMADAENEFLFRKLTTEA